MISPFADGRQLGNHGHHFRVLQVFAINPSLGCLGNTFMLFLIVKEVKEGKEQALRPDGPGFWSPLQNY